MLPWLSEHAADLLGLAGVLALVRAGYLLHPVVAWAVTGAALLFLSRLLAAAERRAAPPNEPRAR